MPDDSFDPYWQWLQIPPHERPVDHYRLLGLPLFEADPRRIEQAADERMTLVRSFQSGPRMAHTQKLLNEMSAARLCLLNVVNKASYDALLRGRLALGAGAPMTPPAPANLPSALPYTPPYPAAPYPAPPPYGVAPYPPAATHPGASPPVGYVPPPVVPPPPPPVAPPPTHPGMHSTAAPQVASSPASHSDETVESPRGSFVSRPAFLVFAVMIFVGVGAIIFVAWRSRSNRDEPAVAQDDKKATDASPVVEAADGAGGSTTGRKSRAKRSRLTHDERDPDGTVYILQEGTGELHFAAQTAERLGERLALETSGNDQVITGWGPPDETLAWNFKVLKPDIFRMELVYAATDESRGARFAFRVDEEEIKTGQVESTGAEDKFRTDVFHVTVKRNGPHEFSLTVLDLPAKGQVVFKSVRLIPKGLGDKK